MPTSVLYLFLLLWTADSGATVVEFGAVLYTVAQAGSEAPKSSGTNEQLVRLSRHVRSLYRAESLATVETDCLDPLQRCYQSSFPIAWTRPWAQETFFGQGI